MPKGGFAARRRLQKAALFAPFCQSAKKRRPVMSRRRWARSARGAKARDGPENCQSV